MITYNEIKEKVKALKIELIRKEDYTLAAEAREIELMLEDYEAVEELMEESEYKSLYAMNIQAEFERASGCAWAASALGIMLEDLDMLHTRRI